MTQGVGLVMQGGGALGAYEVGALTRIYQAGYEPEIITGTSIGALNAAVIAAPKLGDPIETLHALWEHLSHTPGFIWHSSQKLLSASLGNPHFFKLHPPSFMSETKPSIYDITPALETMEKFIDFEHLNSEYAPRLVITATNVATGQIERFSNRDHYLTSRHIMASGSLPPGFPPIELDGHFYWDGGLYDNTPIRSLLRILDDHQIAHMPIFLIELFCPEGIIPSTVEEAIYRMTELVFEDKFWHMLDGDKCAQHYSKMLWDLDNLVPENSPIRQCEHYQSLMTMRALSHIITVQAEHNALSGVVDFDPKSINDRIKTGYLAADEALRKYSGRIDAIMTAKSKGHMTESVHSKHKPYPEEKRCQ
ncbi:patatin-like phospholipase family protein [Pseudovibrio sp. POLY-S9]|uniref:patatin-like phospholipase family protein n=1 Tax=Pseudovibrio sp. POLY-S9 TaxID=1576596 RepID=UPI000B2573FA|nr:patatin-like phospholipase family protein [Pseudovibrio sp. POLY-S9]